MCMDNYNSFFIVTVEDKHAEYEVLIDSISDDHMVVRREIRGRIETEISLGYDTSSFDLQVRRAKRAKAFV